MRAQVLRWVQVLTAVLVLGVLGWHWGTEPFLAALTRVDPTSVTAATCAGVLTTVCCAWRWTLVARAVGVALPLRAAVVACYRSQLTNVLTPGGVVGDVDRAVRHGRTAGNASAAARSVVWDRVLGQLVLVVLGAGALLLLPSPVTGRVRGVLLAAACTVVAAGALLGARLVRRRLRWWSPGLLAGVVLASVGAATGCLATFLVAAREAGTDAPTSRVVPLALVVLLAGALPNLAGWGPKEGVAAWSFGAAGLGAERGLSTAVLFGVLVLASTLPGALLPVLPAAARWAGHLVPRRRPTAGAVDGRPCG